MSKYMITDGHGNYLRRDAKGNFCPCKEKILGDVYEQRNKAKNVLENCVNKNLRDRYRIIEIADEIRKDKKLEQSKSVKLEMTIKPKENITKKIGSEIYDDETMDKLITQIDELSNFAESAEQRKEQLLKILSDVDKEISDIDHYIEFGGSFNAYQGWLAFTMLQNRLRKRRKIKDELHILTQLGECKINASMIDGIKKNIGNLSTREYQPRILKELFD